MNVTSIADRFKLVYTAAIPYFFFKYFFFVNVSRFCDRILTHTVYTYIYL